MNFLYAALRRVPILRRICPTAGRRERVRGRATPNTVLYAFHCGPSTQNERFQRYKVGKTVDLARRIRPYRTIYPNGQVFYSVACADIDVAERWLHDVLKMSGYHVAREIFEVPPDVMKATMDAVVGLHRFWLVNGKRPGRIRTLAKATY